MNAQQLNLLQRAFDSNARHYDEERRKLIPCFDDFYGTVLRSVALMPAPGPSKILDLGSGTGLLARMLVEVYPDADYTLCDPSEEMLVRARERFPVKSRLSTVACDYSQEGFETKLPHEQYDLIVSGLSIHHLEDQDKASLFKTLRRMVGADGWFVNADQGYASNPAWSDHYERWWRDDVESTDLSRQSLDASYKRRSLDLTASVSFQLDALRSAGFATVELPYRNGIFAVFVATTERRSEA